MARKSVGIVEGTYATDIGIRSAGIATFAFIGNVIVLIIGIVMFSIVARLLGPAQYGVYTIALAVAGFVGAFGNFNMGAYLNNIIPRLKAEKQGVGIGTVIGDVLMFIIALSILLMTLGFIFGGVVSKYIFNAPSYTFDIDLAMLSLMWAMMYPVFSDVLVSLGTGREVTISVISGICFQAVISILLVVLGFGATGAIVGYLIGVTISVALTLLFIVRRVKLNFTLAGIRQRITRMLSFSVPVTVSGMINSVTVNFIVVLFGLFFVPAAIIGQYGVATKVGTVIAAVSGSIAIVLIPMFATAIHNKRSRKHVGSLYENSLYYGALFAAPIVVYASVLSSDIVVTIFTSAYHLTILYMPLISIGTFIGVAASCMFALMLSFGRVSKVLRISLIVSLIQVVSMFILGYFFSVVGIIVAYFFIGNTALLLLYFREVKLLGINVSYTPLMRVMAANLILALLMSPLLLLSIRPLYILFIGVAEIILVYPIVLAKIGAISKDRISILYKVAKELPLGWILMSILNYVTIFMS